MKKAILLTALYFTLFQLFAQTDPGRTDGALDVSLTGAATYTVPISVPPGIKDVVPQIALSYNSQGGNGMAGWGWNISGLSAISRIPATEYHDGFIDPVDFDDMDRFALDGQRLLLVDGTGNYGAPGSEYVTENYSNIKIVAYETHPDGSNYGPKYFKVFYPNGNIAIYGNGDYGTKKLSWGITKWENPQDICIKYEYKGTHELLIIDKILYGSKTDQSHYNELDFYFTVIERFEHFYIGGVYFQKNLKLSDITVKANGNTYRKYDIEYELNSLEYEKISNIQEFNAENHKFKSIEFSYDETSNSDLFQHTETSLGIINVNAQNAEYISGDFDGDTKMDVIVYPTTGADAKKKYWYITELGEGGYNPPYEHNVGSFQTIFPTKWLTHNNKVLNEQGWTVVKTIGNDYSFKVYSNGNTNPIYYQYEKLVSGLPTTTVPTGGCDDPYGCEPTSTTQKTFPKKIFSGDFNGDGLTDAIAIDKPLSSYYCDYDPWDEDCVNWDTWIFSKKVYFIDLKRDVTSNFWLEVGSLTDNLPVSSNDYNIEVADYNGDGKSDFYVFREGRIRVYSLNNTNDALVKIADYGNSNIHVSTTLLGDFNGDGKTDFLQPASINEDSWNLYRSRSGNFTNQAFTGNNISIGTSYEIEDHGYYGWTDENGNYNWDCLHLDVSYIANDLNGDGKPEILKVRNFTGSNQCYIPGVDSIPVYTQLVLIENKGFFDLHNGQPGYNVETSELYNYDIGRYPIPIFLNHNNLNKNLELSLLSDDLIHSFKHTKDNREDVLIREIDNNEIHHTITYEPLVEEEYKDTEIYAYRPGYEQTYPNINIEKATQLKVVRKMEMEADNYYQKRQLSYYNAVSNLEGLGFLGFKSRLATTWYNEEVQGPISNVTIHDFNKRGAITDSYSSLNLQWSFENIPSNYISKTSYQYQTSGGDGDVFINLPEYVDTQNKLGDTSQKVTYTYDNYNNVESAETKLYNGYNYNTYIGSNTVDFTYYNNPTPTDHTYHVGRLDTKTETSEIYGGSFTNFDDYDYYTGDDSNLVQYLKKRGNGPDMVTNEFSYDDYGNIETITLSADDIIDRTETFTYDPTHRFIEEHTDIQGLTSTFRHDPDSGVILSEKDPYGNKTSYEYDGWGRKTKEIDYLNNETNILRIGVSPGGIYERITYSDGQQIESTYDVLGNLIHNVAKGLDHNIYSITEYDELGRIFKKSEPKLGGGSTHWTYYNFDEYGRPEETITPAGKTITTTYNGRETSVFDGTKTVTTLIDAAGNKESITDEGGIIDYTYHANGAMKTANYGGRIVSTQIDNWGRKKQLDDPDAGTYTYDYNDIGELLEETTPRGTTTYTYDDWGKIENRRIIGDHTSLSINYTYDSNSKQLISINGRDYHNKFDIFYQTFEYDALHRLNFMEEFISQMNSGTKKYQKSLEFDPLGRVDLINYNIEYNGQTQLVSTENIYSDEGILSKLKDVNTGDILWQLGVENAYGQPESIALGNDIVKYRSYDEYGFPETIVDKHAYNGDDPVLDMYYNFNSQKGTLSSRDRSHNGFISNESYAYDTQDRLTNISSTYGNHTQTYDDRGRITNNSNIGAYTYSGNSYQASKVRLNGSGNGYYSDHNQQDIVYNAFKKPVWIHEEGYGRVDFEYNPISMTRAAAYYGSEDENIQDRPYIKSYSSIIPVEITEDKVNGSIKIATFVGGDAYSAPIVHIKETGDNPKDDYYYLHRDYLGSILAITDSDANIVEQRQFGAWGKTDKFLNSDGDTAFTHETSLLNRGYTGHEHFFGVGLIHMNGRLYDAKLGRFLAPDNFVQDPYNTQNYNRYSYVWNNPLSYVDQNGENPWVVTAVLLSFIYLKGARDNKDDNGNWQWNPFKWNDFPTVSISSTGTFDGNGGIDFNMQYTVTPTGTSTEVSVDSQINGHFSIPGYTSETDKLNNLKEIDAKNPFMDTTIDYNTNTVYVEELTMKGFYPDDEFENFSALDLSDPTSYEFNHIISAYRLAYLLSKPRELGVTFGELFNYSTQDGWVHNDWDRPGHGGQFHKDYLVQGRHFVEVFIPGKYAVHFHVGSLESINSSTGYPMIVINTSDYMGEVESYMLFENGSMLRDDVWHYIKTGEYRNTLFSN